MHALRWPTLAQRAVVVLLALLCAAPLTLICVRATDLTLLYKFFSYLAFLVGTACYVVGAVAMLSLWGYDCDAAPPAPGSWRYALMCAFVRYVLPLLVVLPNVVAFVLVFVVFVDGRIYTRNLKPELPEWPRRFGLIHTQDFAVHTLPALMALLVLLALRRVARSHMHAQYAAYAACSPWRLRAYCAYVACVGTLPLLVYGAATDWHARYGIALTSAGGLVMALVLGLSFGLAYLYFLVPSARELSDGFAPCAPAGIESTRVLCDGPAQGAEQRGALVWRGQARGTEFYDTVELEIP